MNIVKHCLSGCTKCIGANCFVLCLDSHPHVFVIWLLALFYNVFCLVLLLLLASVWPETRIICVITVCQRLNLFCLKSSYLIKYVPAVEFLSSLQHQVFSKNKNKQQQQGGFGYFMLACLVKGKIFFGRFVWKEIGIEIHDRYTWRDISLSSIPVGWVYLWA